MRKLLTVAALAFPASLAFSEPPPSGDTHHHLEHKGVPSTDELPGGRSALPPDGKPAFSDYTRRPPDGALPSQVPAIAPALPAGARPEERK
jgi:hypothetical protein